MFLFHNTYLMFFIRTNMKLEKKISSVEEFLESEIAKKEKRAQFKDNQVVLKLMSGGEHGKIQLAVGVAVVSKFKKLVSPGGGWWFKTEASIFCPKVKSVVTPDLTGWKRVNTPKEPTGYPIKEKPDWVCEVAFSTLREDLRELKLIYEREEIPFYWVVDVKNERLVVFELLEKKLVQTHELFSTDGFVETPPFMGDKLNMSEIFGLED
jgi:Uma2 family endonuclease